MRCIWEADELAQSVQSDYLKYERAADAFARFCKQPVATTPKSIIGDPAAAVYLQSAAKSQADKKYRTVIYIVAVCLTGLAAYLATQPLYNGVLGTVLALPVGLFAGHTMRQSLRTNEPRLETLISDVSQEKRDNILSFEEFCRRAASGKFGIVERYPNGRIQPFDDDMLKCFSADGGKLLVLSDNPRDWLAIRRRPVPRREILIDARSAVASNLLTSETLIKMDDEEAFEAKFRWLLERARGDDSTSKSFRHLLNLIKAFRHPDIMALGTLKAKEDVLENEGFTRTIIHRMHSGNYEPFQKFLKTLPLHELP
jgi:hypothetical protein